MSEGHYFDAEPAVPSRRRTVRLVLPDLTLDLEVDRGVFAGARVDPGTKLLLLEAPMPPPDVTDVIDVGCGYGPIAVTVGRRAPDATVWAVDVNRRALALCAANADANATVNVRTATPDEVPPDMRFGALYANPPVRIGKAALRSLLDRWLARLTPDGHAHLVVHKHLGADSLARDLTAASHPVQRLTSRGGYRILAVGPQP